MTIERPEDSATKRAVELARELPVAIPPEARREEMRTAVLAAAAAARRSPGRASRRVYAVVGAMFATAAAVTAIVAVVQDEPVLARHTAVAHRGAVHPTAGARFTTTTLPDETVRLIDGTIAVEVDPLAPGERFRVVVGDGEVEVRGTAFDVVASDDRLIAVTVQRGRVEVRPVGGMIRVLGAGDAWHRTVTAAVDAPPIQAMVRAPRAPLHMTTLPPKPAIAMPVARTADALALDEAWAAMRTAKFAAAAVAFARVVAIAPDGALADDARFWAAVAHSRAGERPTAIAGFRELVDRHASSAHADEASVMLGWLLLETGVFDEARRRFTLGLTASVVEVRTSAQSGLDVLDKP